MYVPKSARNAWNTDGAALEFYKSYDVSDWVLESSENQEVRSLSCNRTHTPAADGFGRVISLGPWFFFSEVVFGQQIRARHFPPLFFCF